MYPQQNISNSEKATPAVLNKETKRLNRYLVACGICGLGLVTILGYVIIAVILHDKNSASGDLSALDIVIPAIFFDIFIAIPLGTVMGVATIVQIRKYITNFSKTFPKGWLVFGAISIILCFVPMMLTAFAFCFLYVLNSIQNFI